MADSTTQTIENIAYVDSRVEVDGHTYVNCQFSNVTFAYSGGPAPSFVGCTFDGIVLQFGGQATDTLSFLTNMHRGGFAQSVQALLGAVRSSGRMMNV